MNQLGDLFVRRSNNSEDRINVDKPLWSQDTYFGRWRHYAFITDFRTVFVSEKKLREAKKLCEDYKSAYGVIACQLVNQGINAIINYSNRNPMSDDPEDISMIHQAFALATTASCAAALGFRNILASRGTLFERFVPFCAVAAGNIVNLPIMRQREITRGIPIFTKDGDERIMISRIAAIKGISECVVTRILMAAPGMLLVPVVTQRLRRYCFYQLRPWLAMPIEISLSTICLLVMIPSALALYPQRNSMKPGLMKMYPGEYEEFQKAIGDCSHPDKVYYSKGL